MILSCRIRRHIMSVCTAIGRARFDCSVKVQNFPCKLFYILHMYVMSGQYKNAITLYQFFCRLLFSHIVFVKLISVNSSSFMFHCRVTAHYVNARAYSPTEGHLDCSKFWLQTLLLCSFLFTSPCPYICLLVPYYFL